MDHDGDRWRDKEGRGGIKRGRAGRVARGKEGVRETRVKSKSQQESPWTSAVCRSASPASLFVRVRRRTRFLRTCTSGLAKIHPVRVYLGPRVIYTRWLKLNISTEEGRGREGGRNEGARGGGKEGGDGDDGSGGDDGDEAEPRELCRKIVKPVLPFSWCSPARAATRSIAGRQIVRIYLRECCSSIP